jgi:TolB-like protein
MKIFQAVKITAALAIACASLLPGAARADGYRDLSARIARSAAANSVRKIAVLDFAGKGGAGKSETEYVAEKMGTHLAGSKTLALIERSLLEKVLKETRLSSLAGGMADKAEILKGMFSVDAVVTGTVFADGGRLRVLARLIDLKTGSVLFAAEAEAARLPPDFGETSFDGMGLPDVPMPDFAGWPDGAVRGRSSLRDAVADSGDASCSGRRRGLARANAELVEAKAWYWAVKMRKPGFKTSDLTRNPGSEIIDPEVKAQFYRLLSEYHESGNVPPPDPAKISGLLELLKAEAGVANECGLN